MKITISNKIRIQEPPDVLKEILIDTLRVKNPKYFDAINQGYRAYGINPHIYNFSVLPDESLVIPRGFRIKLLDLVKKLNLEPEIVDNATYFPANFDIDSSVIIFRDYQAVAVKSLVEQREGLLIAPPGSGKTIMGISLLPLLGQPMLWLTHTDRLVKQTLERVNQFLPSLRDEDKGVIGGGKWDLGKLFTIGMVQTLIRRPEQAYELMNKFGIVILDECLPAGTKIVMLDGSIKNIEDTTNGESTTFGVISNKFERETNTLVSFRGGWGTLSGTETHTLPYIPVNSLIKNLHTNTLKPIKEKQVVFGTMSKISKKDLLLIKADNCHTEKYSIGKNKARLLALIACDGHIEKHLQCIQIGVIKDKEWFIDEMHINTSFVADPDIRTSNCTRGDIIIRAYSKELISFLNEFILAGKKNTLFVPNIIEHTSLDDIKNYLQVVFDTEGGLNKNQITITMATPEFLLGVQHLLKKFGIMARIIPIKHKNGKDYLRLAISGYDAFLFHKKIGFSMDRKQKDLLEIVKRANKFVRLIKYKGITYRCMPILTKKTDKINTKVYDFTTKEHLFIANGVLSSNCHHCPASTFLEIVSKFNPYFLYGLTATPYRRDKLEALMFQSLGSEKTRIPLEDVEKEGGIIVPTVVYKPIQSKTISGTNTQKLMTDYIVSNDKRNGIIVGDVLKEAMDGNFCIVISDRRAHCEALYELIQLSWEKTGIATGKYNKKYVDEQVERYYKNEITVLVCTFQLLGEGFDIDFLNRAFIASPFRAEGKAEQLIGRIQRSAPKTGKKDAIVYDYVDVNVGVFKSQFFTRSGKDCRYNLYERLGARVVPYSEYDMNG